MSALLNVIPEEKVLRGGKIAGNVFTTKEARALEAALKQRVKGEVRFDAGTRAIYAVDGSNYRQVPIGAVIPKNVDDVIATVAACREFGAPVLSRGGGTSLAGQCCNVAVVIDWTKYLHRVLEIDGRNRKARVQPGCVLDALRNEASERYGLTFGPDPATHTHCTLGGMIGNNSCGAHAQMNGAVSNNVDSLDVLLYDGTRMRAGWMSVDEWEQKIAQGGREGEILRQLRGLRDRYQKEIQRRFPPIPRRVSGYNLDQLIPNEDGRINLGRALVGSEGTLVTILEATLDLIHNPPYQTLVVLGYPDVYHAGDHVPEILEYEPMAFEGLDDTLIRNMKKKGMHTKYLSLLPEGKGWLMVQFPGDSREEADGRAHAMMDRLKRGQRPPSMKLYDDPKDEKAVWEVRESGLGATAFVPGEPLGWPGWEDAGVPPSEVGDYLRDFCKLLNKYDYKASLYGHFGQGCIHCRISFDLLSRAGVKKYRKFAGEAADLVVRYGGSLSGEHGDGQSRAELLPKMFGKEIMQAFREYKSIWDPDWKMNPGKVIDAYKITENLRLGGDYHPWEPKTHFKYPEDQGSFARATLRCVGVGNCRRHHSDNAEDQTMCPSYMVTLEEKHATRGRAHLLWEMLQGDPIEKRWRDDNVKEALDLCLSCKGCKGDCPVNVDMATYKAEFLAHYWDGRLRPRSAYAFGWIDKWAQLAMLAPGLVNLATSLPGLSDLAKLLAGMPQERKVPKFAPETFVHWIGNRKPARRRGSKGSVFLFPDTFNNHFFTQTARAAVEVLEYLGYEVVVPRQHVCCGRPLYDYGFLDMAKSYLENIFRVLRPALEQRIPIVVLEPSCWSVLRDEINGLFPEREETHRIMENTYLLGEFLDKFVPEEALPQLPSAAMLHGHCHHKAIIKGAEHERKVLEKMGITTRMLSDGCCGMAGSFGFEKDKYDVSVKVGEHGILPKVRSAGLRELIVADGFSCREQVAQLTERHALHLAEVLKLAIDGGAVSPGNYPEQRFVQEHEAAVRKSMAQASLPLLGVAAGTAAAWLLIRKRGANGHANSEVR